jgi:hypothetical protein
MSKPKEKKNIKEVVTRKKNITESDPIPPFDTHDNDKIGHVYSKERV